MSHAGLSPFAVAGMVNGPSFVMREVRDATDTLVSFRTDLTASECRMLVMAMEHKSSPSG